MNKLKSILYGSPAIIIIIYMVFGSLWIIFSDQMIFTLSDDPAYLTRAQTYKGWFFILITGFLLYILVQSNNTYLGNVINELNESRNRFRDTFEQAAVGIAHHTKRKNWIRINQKFCDFLGYSREELLSKSFETILHRDDLETIQTLDKSLLNKKTDYYRSEQRYIRKDGTILQALTTKSIAKNEDTSFEYFITIIEDISKQKEAENKLKDTIHQKEMLLGELHHRVKNNLALISALFELQSSFINDDIVTKILRDNRIRIKTLALAHDSFSEEKARVELDFTNYLNMLVDFIKQSNKKDGFPIELKVEIDNARMSINQAIPCGLICNELLSNAYQHAFDANSDNRIVHINFKKDRNYGILKISDNGKGMKNKTMYEYPKTYGFTIVKTLADQLKADVEINDNDGTTFIIRFELTYTKGSGSTMLPEDS